VRDSVGKIFRLVGTVQEITDQKRAEDQVIQNLAIAEAARVEAEALRKATLALTLDLRMDFVMEALLGSLEELVPYSCARVLALEGGSNVLALGERQIPALSQTSPKYHPGFPLTLTTDESPLLMRVLKKRKSVLVSDTKLEKDWETFKRHAHLRSWLSVPLIASGQCWGLLGWAYQSRPVHKRPSSPSRIVCDPCCGSNPQFAAVCPRRDVCKLRDAETALEADQRGKRVAENFPKPDRKKSN